MIHGITEAGMADGMTRGIMADGMAASTIRGTTAAGTAHGDITTPDGTEDGVLTGTDTTIMDQLKGPMYGEAADIRQDQTASSQAEAAHAPDLAHQQEHHAIWPRHLRQVFPERIQLE